MAPRGYVDSEKKPLTPDHIKAIRELLQKHNDGSKLLVPGDEGYDDSIKRWSSAAIKQAPASLIPLRPETIALILPFIAEHDIDLAVKGGGHSTGGASSTAKGLAIDLAYIKDIEVDASAQTVRVGGGANWGQVDAALATHGLATVGGTVSDTGVGGLVLGGGYGWLSGKHGLSIDNFVSAKVVLADGKIVTASKNENPDLFWGLRGAGQNFGIVIEFVLQAHQQGQVWAGMMIFPPPLLPQVTEIMNEVIPSLNGKGAGGVGFARPPPAGGQLVVLAAIFFDGSEAEGERAFKGLLDLNPIMNMVKACDYAEANKMLSPPAGLRASLKGATFILPIRVEFAQKMLDSYAEFTEKIPDAAGSMILFELFNPSKVCKLASNSDMSFANRGMHCNAMVGPFWTDPANDTACRQWARDTATAFDVELADVRKLRKAEDAVLIYGNYEHYDHQGGDVFGANYSRLAKLKQEYDPTNMFDKLFAVAPAA